MDTYIGRITHTYKHKGQDTHIQTQRRQRGICICVGVYKITHTHRHKDQDTHIQTQRSGDIEQYRGYMYMCRCRYANSIHVKRHNIDMYGHMHTYINT